MLSQVARESYLAISHRRLFIKTLIMEWFRQKEEGEQVINHDYAQASIRGQIDSLMLLEDTAQNPY